MIISDLNYLENTSEEVIGGTTSRNVYETIRINKYVSSYFKAVGNLATSISDATASGHNTLAETYNATNTTPYSSSAHGEAVSGSY
ncbi:MAG: hypothetical protein V7K69_23425 [Nostoc sp.]|uniref:hypothetical protein n=1 Tax=Nostoc sp. TaxID=1180 RepID=UPI002FF5B1AC